MRDLFGEESNDGEAEGEAEVGGQGARKKRRVLDDGDDDE
jgi:hypothetical protein